MDNQGKSALGMALFALLLSVIFYWAGTITTGRFLFTLGLMWAGVFVIIYVVPIVTTKWVAVCAGILFFAAGLLFPITAALLIAVSPKMFGAGGAIPLVKSRVEKAVLGTAQPGVPAFPLLPAGACLTELDNVSKTLALVDVQEEWRRNNPNPLTTELRKHEAALGQLKAHLTVLQDRRDTCVRAVCKSQRATEIGPIEALEAGLVAHWYSQGAQMKRGSQAAKLIADFQDNQANVAAQRSSVEIVYQACLGNVATPKAVAGAGGAAIGNKTAESSSLATVVWVEMLIFLGAIVCWIFGVPRVACALVVAGAFVVLYWAVFEDGGLVMTDAGRKVLNLLPTKMAAPMKKYLPGVLAGLGIYLGLVVLSFTKVGRMIVTPVIVIGTILGVCLLIFWLTHGGWTWLTGLVA